METDLLSPVEKNTGRRIMILKKLTIILLYITGVSSLGYIISILTFYFHARNILGWFPTYGDPDPGELAIYNVYHKIIDPSFVIWITCLLAWILLCVFYTIKNRKEYKGKHIAFSFIGHAISICITFSPIFEWYVD
jgi:hypothetical protein